jgi:hypothetical protein
MATLIEIPATRCTAHCPSCGVQTDFLMFESGAGGEFGTYVGDKTGTLYRLDMSSVNYLGKSVEGLLAPAVAAEEGTGNLRSIPEQVECKSCGSIFSADTLTFGDDVAVVAHLLS